MSRKIVPGKIRFSHPTLSRSSERLIEVEIFDTASSRLVMKAEVSAADFADALGSRQVPMTMEIYDTYEVIGKFLHTKSVQLPLKRYDFRDEKVWCEAIAEAVKPYEVDGWEWDGYHGAASKDGGYSACLVRYDDDPNEEDLASIERQFMLRRHALTDALKRLDEEEQARLGARRGEAKEVK